ncbi:pyridoxal phosphate-dependent aminotransferase [Enterococcus saccharolyticus]|uniref:alanine transaminase n=1 Tax=Enterococcus saccharolyticus subsp. saccharolyticus ATCC 43076 TaxID=1139996 RepID=S0NHC5_9ENTE|nr:pyridoxal phosphate-dependent aminotransferase [Enterococcus saccharolyticus]EOT29697.1 alanine-synthesizing transaminase AlaT [Enterococcus saccharolyticus subsp. saccharolyticus ATCC 43076]EOT80857.1 alanine-synthesizing transaminase AlaT [Enterococcus saccharolyticus subsp. saccharolyticus ATCC 43076]OJG89683.1 alanine-synthesizing transaminase AlaT [Enterococcus saccharolyticus]
MRNFEKSSKLEGVSYDVRGPVLEEADRMQEEGISILKLNTGNPATFGFEAPNEIIRDLIMNVRESEGYSDSKGIFSARKAIEQYCQLKNFPNVTINDIYTGNGVSELITMSMQGLCDNGDEILVPMPDYPLWTASVSLAGGKPVHYICDEESDWNPDIADIRSKITSKTKAIVLINPNNPTGAVYPKEILEQIVDIAREFDLIIFSDEIYDRLLMDGHQHVPIATLAPDRPVVTFSGLSKSHRVAGFRVGWMVLSGDKRHIKDYIEGLNMLSSMRLCSNVLSQHIVQTALGGYQSIDKLLLPGGRIYEQREFIYNAINDIPGLSAVKPKAAFYMFPKIDTKRFNILDDEKFVLDFLHEHHVLMVHGGGFNWQQPDHFRIVYLPNIEELKLTADKMREFLSTYKQK